MFLNARFVFVFESEFVFVLESEIRVCFWIRVFLFFNRFQNTGTFPIDISSDFKWYRSKIEISFAGPSIDTLYAIFFIKELEPCRLNFFFLDIVLLILRLTGNITTDHRRRYWRFSSFHFCPSVCPSVCLYNFYCTNLIFFLCRHILFFNCNRVFNIIKLIC